jgi:hypothetical protein
VSSADTLAATAGGNQNSDMGECIGTKIAGAA